MRIDLLATGMSALVAQAATPSQKLSFTRFELGNARTFDYSPSMSQAAGTIFYTGNASKMRFVPLSATEVSIKCRAEHNDPTGVIGNLMLFVTLNDTEYPFVLVRPHDVTNVKLQTIVHKAGMTLIIDVGLSMPNLLNRFDFTNLVAPRPEWLAVTRPADLPNPFVETHDQASIHSHQYTGRHTHVINRRNMWYGYPIGLHLDDPDQLLVADGGTVGDGYLYVPPT